ncbi:MAG TPA: cell division protein FtsZ, partial [Terriglobia bacterium]|nr:cell division protein FtsZ [Terriglobia bacterium]
SSPLLEEASIQGARGVLLNITGSSRLGMHEVDEAAKIIQRAADEEANIIFGTVLDEDMADEVKITVIATGFDKKEARPAFEVATPRIEARAPEIRPEPAPLVQAAKANGSSAVVPMQETLSQPTSVFNKNDLEVPAFLRKKMAES